MSDTETALQRLVAKADRDEAKQKIEVITGILSVLYDRAAAYTNLILVAGFAAFFTIWTTMKDTMSRTEMLLTASAVTLSLVIFLAWEVTMMILRVHFFQSTASALNAPPDKLAEALDARKRAEECFNVKLMRAWYVILMLTIVPGFGGGLILLYSFLRQLLS